MGRKPAGEAAVAELQVLSFWEVPELTVPLPAIGLYLLACPFKGRMETIFPSHVV